MQFGLICNIMQAAPLQHIDLILKNMSLILTIIHRCIFDKTSTGTEADCENTLVYSRCYFFPHELSLTKVTVT